MRMKSSSRCSGSMVVNGTTSLPSSTVDHQSKYVHFISNSSKSTDGDPQCRNRWLSLVRAGRIEDDVAVKPELCEGSLYRLPAPGPEVCPQSVLTVDQTLIRIVYRPFIRLCLGTPQEMTSRLVISDSIRLRGETTKPTPRTTRASAIPSSTLLLTQKFNTRSNAWFLRQEPWILSVPTTRLPSKLPAILRLPMPPPMMYSLPHNQLMLSPQPRSISSYRRTLPTWNIITISPAKNPTLLLATDRHLPLLQHLLLDHRSLSVLLTRRPVPSTNLRN